jgi:hypothetical protein
LASVYAEWMISEWVHTASKFAPPAELLADNWKILNERLTYWLISACCVLYGYVIIVWVLMRMNR